jgi:hypothetical protein
VKTSAKGNCKIIHAVIKCQSQAKKKKKERMSEQDSVTKKVFLLKIAKALNTSMVCSWRDGSAVKSTTCSCRGPRLGSYHPHDSSQPHITPVLGDLMSFLF